MQIAIGAKAATLAKNNDHARQVAERQKVAATAALGELTNTSKNKLIQADANRAALIKKQVDKAAQEVAKARELSNKAKEDFADDTEQKRQSLDQTLKHASARKQAITTAIVEKAGGDYKKACEMSAQKKKQTESEAAEGEAKTSAKLDKADRRRKSRAPRLAR